MHMQLVGSLNYFICNGFGPSGFYNAVALWSLSSIQDGMSIPLRPPAASTGSLHAENEDFVAQWVGDDDKCVCVCVCVGRNT